MKKWVCLVYNIFLNEMVTSPIYCLRRKQGPFVILAVLLFLATLLGVYVNSQKGWDKLGDDALALVILPLGACLSAWFAFKNRERVKFYKDHVVISPRISMSYDQLHEIIVEMRKGYKGTSQYYLIFLMESGSEELVDLWTLNFSLSELEEALKSTSFQGALSLDDDALEKFA